MSTKVAIRRTEPRRGLGRERSQVKKQQNNTHVLIGVVIAVSLIITFVTGWIWHWVPALGAIVVTLGLMKATKG